MESITENYVMKLRLNFITKNVIIRNDDVTMVRMLEYCRMVLSLRELF